MDEITVQQLQDNFDEIFETVEKDKKSYYIIDEDGERFVMMPYDEFNEYKQYFENNNEAP